MNPNFLWRLARVCILAGVSALLWPGCGKPAQFISPAQVRNGMSYYPFSNNPLIDTATGDYIEDGVFPAGDTLTFEVNYYSQDLPDGVFLYGSSGSGETLVAETPWTPASFSFLQLMDTAVLKFAIPANAKSGTGIGITVVIRNDDSLSLTRSVEFQVQ